MPKARVTTMNRIPRRAYRNNSMVKQVIFMYLSHITDIILGTFYKFTLIIMPRPSR